MKEFLSRGGHVFIDRNVEEDVAAYSELVARGFRAVPLTVIGEHTVVGFDEPALRSALAHAGGS